ncbi:unnamed protein product, partial [Mesorhabditis spiculigera]
MIFQLNDRTACALASSAAAEGAENAPILSPPHTWTESSDESTSDETARQDERLLFTATVSIPDGSILASQPVSNAYEAKELEVGTCFLKLLLGTGQSFFLSAAATSIRQRVFSRVKCGATSRACELQCEFEQGADGQRKARVAALCLRSAFGPTAGPVQPTSFTTKHSLSCALTHIDYASVPFIGHLPTDVIGRSLLSFVYAPDVHIIRQAHLDLHNQQGGVVRSIGPIRLVAYNGALLTVETEWSAYISPWSRKIEMVVARHRVFDAPVGDADVLSPPPAGTPTFTLPLPLVKTFEEELKTIMSRPVHDSPATTPTLTNPFAQFQALQAIRPLYPLGLSTQSPDLYSYVERLVENLVVQGTPGNVHEQLAHFQQQDKPTSSSAPATPSPMVNAEGAPLSYSQINCLENVHRLLKSQQTPAHERPQPVVHDLSAAQDSLPLTRAVLLEHTRRWEEQCKTTWHHRLTRKRHQNHDGSEQGAEPTTAKKSRSGARSPKWTAPRPLPPNPSPPTAYQITSTPLPAAGTPRPSAFHQVAPRSIVRPGTVPGPSVIQPTHDHTTLKARHPVRSAKLSNVGLGNPYDLSRFSMASNEEIQRKKKQYGLVLKKPNQVTNVKVIAPIFGGSDDELDSLDAPKQGNSGASLRTLKEAERLQQQALAADPTIFDYDKNYDEIQRKRDEKKAEDKVKDKERQSKYADDIMRAHMIRNLEEKSREERLQQRERIKEKGEFDEKEVFVTGAYRQLMEEVEVYRKEEARQNLIDEATAIDKQKIWQSGFARTILSSIARDGDDGTTSVKQEPETAEKPVEFKPRKATNIRKREKSAEPSEDKKDSDKPKKSIYDTDDEEEAPKPTHKNFGVELRAGLNKPAAKPEENTEKALTKAERLRRAMTPSDEEGEVERRDRRADRKSKKPEPKEEEPAEVDEKPRPKQPKAPRPGTQHAMRRMNDRKMDESEAKQLRLESFKKVLAQRNGPKEIEEARQRYLERVADSVVTLPF